MVTVLLLCTNVMINHVFDNNGRNQCSDINGVCVLAPGSGIPELAFNVGAYDLPQIFFSF